jgi:hypothetical protein
VAARLRLPEARRASAKRGRFQIVGGVVFVDLQSRVDEVISLIEGARAMPMSGSCLVDRVELLARLQEIREELAGQLSGAEQIVRQRDDVVEDGQRQADRIIADARARRAALLSGSAVARDSYGEAERIRQEAVREAQAVRAQAGDLVDRTLATFEVALTRTLAAVTEGRQRIRAEEPGDLDAIGRLVGDLRTRAAGSVSGEDRAESSKDVPASPDESHFFDEEPAEFRGMS